MKHLWLLPIFIAGIVTAQAQSTKPAVSQGASGGINQSNYGKVTEYIAKVTTCIGAQYGEIDNKNYNLENIEKFYVKNKATGNNLLGGVFDMSISQLRSIEKRPGVAPTVMSAADAAFYNENSKALMDAFAKLALTFDEAATYQKGEGITGLTAEEGKARYNEIIDLKNKYYAIATSLLTYNRQMQKKIFPFISAKAGAGKPFYANMFNDYNALMEFAPAISGNYDNDVKAKEASLAVLDKIENDVISHQTQTPPSNNSSNLSSFYSDYYSRAANYISATKKILNSKSPDAQNIKYSYSEYKRSLESLTSIYNDLMK